MTPLEQSVTVPECPYCGIDCPVGYGVCHCQKCGRETTRKIVKDHAVKALRERPQKFVLGHQSPKPPRIDDGKCAYCEDGKCPVPYGYCHDRCGRKTTIQKKNHPSRGVFMGTPAKYATGHGSTTQDRAHTNDMAVFKIDGEPCRLIALTRGFYAIVDADNYEYLSQWMWNAAWMEDSDCYYAHRSVSRKDGDHGTVISMQRQVMGVGYGDARIVDHKYSLATLDNRRSNLRFTDKGGNAQNSKLMRTNKSGFRGVSMCATRKKWSVFIQDGLRTKYLGRYVDIQVAARVWDREALRLYGEFARLNFPEEVELRRAEIAQGS